MRVLVVHDRGDLLDAIKSLLLETVGDRCLIDTAVDMITARDLLRNHHYDLAIIDLTIPVGPLDDDTRIDHANLLLQEIFAGGDLRTPGDLIAISLDSAAVAGIRNRIGEHVLAVIQEDPSGQWRTLLRDRINYVRNTRRSRLAAANSTYDIDVALITALDKEALPYSDLLELTPCPEFAEAKEFLFRAGDERMRRGVVVRVGKSGQAPTASMTQAVLTQFRPKLVIMTGFCGGVRSRLRQGDVAAFLSAAAWDYGKWIERVDSTGVKQPVFQARPDALNVPVRGIARIVRDLAAQPYRFDDAVMGKSARLSDGKLTATRLKPIAAGSGSTVVTSEVMLKRIVDLNENIHAIDMESYGFYLACLNTPVILPDFICIKAVADYCNGAKSSKLHAACSFLSASFAIDLITNYYQFSDLA